MAHGGVSSIYGTRISRMTNAAMKVSVKVSMFDLQSLWLVCAVEVPLVNLDSFRGAKNACS